MLSVRSPRTDSSSAADAELRRLSRIAGAGMTIDLDIYRSAQAMIRQHGDRAAHEAALKAEAHMKAGDTAGVATWLRIVEAVRVLQRREPPAGGTRH